MLRFTKYCILAIRPCSIGSGLVPQRQHRMFEIKATVGEGSKVFNNLEKKAKVHQTWKLS